MSEFGNLTGQKYIEDKKAESEKIWFYEESDFEKEQHSKSIYTSTKSTRRGKKAIKICLHCKERFQIESCSNCGSELFETGVSSDRRYGLFCRSCEKGFISWDCPSCQTTNPIKKTLYSDTEDFHLLLAISNVVTFILGYLLIRSGSPLIGFVMIGSVIASFSLSNQWRNTFYLPPSKKLVANMPAILVCISILLLLFIFLVLANK